jgi:acyl dehydratase
MDKIRLRAPVFHGDTLYAYSEVLQTRSADRADGEMVVFRHWGVNQKEEIVFEGERTVLIKRRTKVQS